MFECDLPEHIHLRVSAVGFKTIGNNNTNSVNDEGLFDTFWNQLMKTEVRCTVPP
jgi:hypothetical protein